MKIFLQTFFGIVAVLIAFILYNTVMFSSRQIEVNAVQAIAIPENAVVHLSEAIQIKTISHENPLAFDSTAFRDFKSFLKITYPLADSLLEVTYINEFSVILRWTGTDPALNPVVFMGHLDVVPAAEENIGLWKVPPFSGAIKDGNIWGRGAIDDKISVIGLMEALELLLKKGYQPSRSLIFAFGHDEELGGLNGAVAIVSHLEKEGIRAAFVIDEGFAISQGLVPGIDEDVALIGTAEKGFVTLKLTIDMEGGHSSMPKPETAIDVLSRAVVKLKENPFPTQITPPVEDFIDHIGPEMRFMQKIAFANPKIFKPFIINSYEKSPSGNALIRTTTSPTIIQGGLKDNVIPYKASASVNFRILPGMRIQEVKDHVIEVIDDERIHLEEGNFSSEAPPYTSTENSGYTILNVTIREIFPEALTSPNLVVGATDSRHYTPLTDQIYRFTPFHLNNDNITTFHGVNERISIDDFENAIRFYARLITNSSTVN